MTDEGRVFLSWFCAAASLLLATIKLLHPGFSAFTPWQAVMVPLLFPVVAWSLWATNEMWISYQINKKGKP